VDRVTTIRFITTAPTVTMPDPTTVGCGSNFSVVLVAAGVTVTVNRTTTATFTIVDGSTSSSGLTTFSLTTGQWASISSPDNSTWLVRKVTGGGAGANAIINNPSSTQTITPTGATTTALAISALSGTTAYAMSVRDAGSTLVFSVDPESNGATSTYGVGGSNGSILLGTAGFVPQFLRLDPSLSLMRVQGAFSTGPTPPVITPGTAGAWAAAEGTEFTNVASAAGLYPDSTQHEYFAKTNGASTKGMMVRVQPGIIHQTAQTAAISTATLCAASAGACNIAGNYTVEWAFTQVGTACGTPGTGGVTFLLTWTDQNGTTHSATSLSMDDSASLVATTATFHFTTSHATAWATGAFNLSSNGSIIQYATGYTACSVGTGSYQLDAWVTRKE
jgi:hypothetical protein